jgi:hypothetical protein
MEGKSFYHAVDLHKSLYNSSVHSSTKFSPNTVHFARELSLITDTFDIRRPKTILNDSVALLQILENVQQIYNKVFENVKYSQECNRNRQQNKAKLRVFTAGDIVYVKPVASSSFHTRLNGPFIIKKKVGPVTYIVQRLGNPYSKAFKIHIDRIYLAPPRTSAIRPEEIAQPPTNVSNDNNVTNNNSFFAPSVPLPSLQSQEEAIIQKPGIPEEEAVIPDVPDTSEQSAQPVIKYNLRPRK